jgi:hypothetical protein
VTSYNWHEQWPHPVATGSAFQDVLVKHCPISPVWAGRNLLTDGALDGEQTAECYVSVLMVADIPLCSKYNNKNKIIYLFPGP